MASKNDKNAAKGGKQHSPKSGSQSAALMARHGTFAEHPSKGLTPLKLHQILQAAEEGDIAAQSALFADMEEKDGHIFAEMSKRKRALMGLDWRVVAPKNASAAEKALTEEVGEWLAGLDDFEALMFDLLDALGHGFAAVEIGWRQTGGLWLPEQFVHRPQGWFTLKDDTVRLLGVDGQPPQDLWPLGWMVHRHQARSGFLARGGLMRTLAWPYLFKNYSVRDLAEFLEIYGLPVRLGKYPAGASDEDKRTLLRALAGIGHNAAGIIPETMLLEMLNAANGSGDTFMAMTEWCERTQSKVILGGTLTSQADGKTSTHALGNVHNEVRHDLLVSDAKQLAATITRQLIWPLLQINKGALDPARIPYFEFDSREPEDMAMYAESLPELVGLGMQIPLEWAHDKLAIPQAAEGEPVLSLPRPDMVLPPEVRAKGNTAAASAHYRQVALSRHGEIIYPDQAALDTGADRYLAAADLPAQLEPLIKSLGQAVAQGQSYEEAARALEAAWPLLDTAQLQEALGRVLFVADLWGQMGGQ
ncbi:MAG: DUF935 family protein [Eikenella sp.]|nr:DUF935 family protein [Eikenella sp.]